MDQRTQLWLLLVLFAVLVWSWVRNRRMRAEFAQRQSTLAVGSEIMTTSGMFATVVELLDDNQMVLQTAPGQTSRWDRRVVARIVTSPAEPLARPGDAGTSSPDAEQPTQTWDDDAATGAVDGGPGPDKGAPGRE